VHVEAVTVLAARKEGTSRFLLLLAFISILRGGKARAKEIVYLTLVLFSILLDPFKTICDCFPAVILVCEIAQRKIDGWTL
jgi:hypothetical protein